MLTGGKRGDCLKLEMCNSQGRPCIAVSGGFWFSAGQGLFELEEQSYCSERCQGHPHDALWVKPYVGNKTRRSKQITNF